MEFYPYSVIQVKLPITGDSSPASASAELLASSDGNGLRDSSWERAARRTLGFLAFGPPHPLNPARCQFYAEIVIKCNN
jgi:hypothetical protein